MSSHPGPVLRTSSSQIPVSILEAVLPKLGIKVPISRILEAVNEEEAKRHAAGVIDWTEASSYSDSDFGCDSNTFAAKESEARRHLTQLAREFNASFPNGKMPRLYSDDPPIDNHNGP